MVRRHHLLDAVIYAHHWAGPAIDGDKPCHLLLNVKRARGGRAPQIYTHAHKLLIAAVCVCGCVCVLYLCVRARACLCAREEVEKNLSQHCVDSFSEFPIGP